MQFELTTRQLSVKCLAAKYSNCRDGPISMGTLCFETLSILNKTERVAFTRKTVDVYSGIKEDTILNEIKIQGSVN